MKAVFFLIFFAAAGAGYAQQVTGDWHGLLDVRGTRLRIVFHIQQAGDRYTATMDSPDQGAVGIPVEEVLVEDTVLTIKMPNLGIRYEGVWQEGSGKIAGTFTQSGFSFPMELKRESAETALKRPQHPSPPFPYEEEAVTYPNEKAGIRLAGTLTLPEGDGPFPAAVLISGSGPQNRDEELMGHKPFLVIADYLTRKGIAVLRFDDRGVGESEGDFGKATSKDFATDVEAAMQFLKSRPEIDTAAVGLIGHSEGGLIAPMVAARNEEVAYVVMLAGPGVTGAEIILHQRRLINEAEGGDTQEATMSEAFMKEAFEVMRNADNLDEARKQLRPLLETLLQKTKSTASLDSAQFEKMVDQQLGSLVTPWFLHFIDYDPAEALEKVDCPVLVLNGGKDLQVDPEQNIPPIIAALGRGGNQDFRVKVLPDLNHLFQTSETGKPSEYAKIEETFSPDALELITEWILEHTR